MKMLSKILVGLIAVLLVMAGSPAYAGGSHAPFGDSGFHKPYAKTCIGKKCSKKAKHRAFLAISGSNNIQDQMFMMMFMMMLLNNSNNTPTYSAIHTPRFSAINTPFGRTYAITRPAF